MDKKELIFRLGTVRREANLSGRELSLRLEMNDGYINRLESNAFLPSWDTFFKILENCNYTPEKFFYHDPKSFESDMELLNKFKSLTEEQKQALLTFLK